MVVFPVLPALSFISLEVFFLYCTPWQYCHTNRLKLHTGTRLSNAGMRGPAGRRQPAAAKPSLDLKARYILFRFFPLTSFALGHSLCVLSIIVRRSAPGSHSGFSPTRSVPSISRKHSPRFSLLNWRRIVIRVIRALGLCVVHVIILFFIPAAHSYPISRVNIVMACRRTGYDRPGIHILPKREHNKNRQ